MAVVSGGTTLIDNGALDSAVPTGSLTLLSTQTASASATIDFTSGIDSTYDSYVFKFINIHPATNRVDFQFQASTNSGSSYGVTLTTTHFKAYHNEAGNSTGLPYVDGDDLAQSTSFQDIFVYMGNDNEDNNSGTLILYNPSSTTFVKHFICRTSVNFDNDAGNPYAQDQFTAGYFNTTSAINSIRFQATSGNIDDGIIKMYGVK